jgi:phage terminase Nu1 subunit (DNA packaging protein)
MLIVGQEKIAEVFGVAPKTIVEWQEQGLPIAKRGSPGVPSEYRSEECISWLVQREVDRTNGESQKDRLARLQGDKVERELRIMDRELIEAKEIEPAIQQWLTDHCAELDQMPEQWIDAVVAVASDSAAVHQVLKDIARQLKESAANYDFSSSPDQEDPSADLRHAA